MLQDLRIVEFEALGPAPFAGMLLADLGAEVIVVHRPGGGPATWQPEGSVLDRGKRSIALDLKSGEDLATAKALIQSADGLIEGLRPGVMERIGLGPQIARALNPALVYGRMTGWGQTGPRAQQAGHDLTYLATTGALFYGGAADRPPASPPTLLGDIGGGALYLVVGMLAGMMQARSTGRGCTVDAAIVDGTSHMMALLMSMAGQFSTTARGQSLLDGAHWSRCYTCADGRHMAVQCMESKFYKVFLETLGLERDERFAAQNDPAQWPAQSAALERFFAKKSQSHWAELFRGKEACVAPVLTPAEAQSDPHIAARGIWQNDAPAAAPRFDADGPVPVPVPVPQRDADRDDILTELKQKGLL